MANWRPIHDSCVDVETEIEGSVLVGAGIYEDPADEIIVTVTFSETDGPGSHQLCLTVGDAYRLAAAMYKVITDLEAKGGR